ncbi:MAG: sterol desaturase family protein [Sandaracinaceae bacterium]|nr:sterol desaturase family protein [Sandaracinaceae bacterium]
MYGYLDPDAPFWLIALLEWADNLARYLLVAGPAFLVFFVWGRERFRRRLIQRAYPGWRQIRREVLYSMSTAAVFGAAGIVLFYGAHAGVLHLYLDVAEHGWGYLVLSTVGLIVGQDAYFYWTHRAMHHPLLYKHVHRVHHLSTNPSPWAAYAFAPAEAAVHAAFVLLVALVAPLHPLALLVWLVFMIVRNVLGHLSIELYPSGLHHALARPLAHDDHPPQPAPPPLPRELRPLLHVLGRADGHDPPRLRARVRAGHDAGRGAGRPWRAFSSRRRFRMIAAS